MKYLDTLYIWVKYYNLPRYFLLNDVWNAVNSVLRIELKNLVMYGHLIQRIMANICRNEDYDLWCHLKTICVTGWRFGTWISFSISYMGCHPKPIDELIFFKMVKGTNQVILLFECATNFWSFSKRNPRLLSDESCHHA